MYNEQVRLSVFIVLNSMLKNHHKPQVWNETILIYLLRLKVCIHKWVRVFKNGPIKIFLRPSSTNFTWSILEHLDPNNLPSSKWRQLFCFSFMNVIGRDAFKTLSKFYEEAFWKDFCQKDLLHISHFNFQDFFFECEFFGEAKQYPLSVVK